MVYYFLSFSHATKSQYYDLNIKDQINGVPNTSKLFNIVQISNAGDKR